MIKKIFALLAIPALLGLFMSGCVKEDFDTTPALENVATWKKTATIAQVIALYKTEAGIVSKLAAGALGDSIIIEGTVISCDSASNFYETITISDETGGIDVKINDSELYLSQGLKPGQKVLVYANNLLIDNYNNIYQLGLATTDEGKLDLTGINSSDFSNYIQRTGLRGKAEPNGPVTIPDILAGKVPIQTLIRIDSVQFWNNYTTFAIPGEDTKQITY
ncbi:MAG: hypothetical protein H6536_01300 [Bacteroidales bacterium]|nr:hypothetical protein [Bacteroidales bacterium]